MVELSDGRELNQELLRLGLAWWYERYAQDCQACDQAQKAAQAARVGLWADHDPTPPWLWGRKDKN